MQLSTLLHFFLIGRDIVQFAYLALYNGCGEQAAEIVDCDTGLRLEIGRLHILEHADIELFSLCILRGALQIAHHHQQAALAHAELEDEAQLVVALYVVDDLHNGAVGRGGIVEHEGAALAHHREPLPVGVLLGGEGIEERMFRTGEDAQCAGRHLSFVVLADGLEHAVVPIIGLEERPHRIGATRGAVGHEEHPGRSAAGLSGCPFSAVPAIPAWDTPR